MKLYIHNLASPSLLVCIIQHHCDFGFISFTIGLYLKKLLRAPFSFDRDRLKSECERERERERENLSTKRPKGAKDPFSNGPEWTVTRCASARQNSTVSALLLSEPGRRVWQHPLSERSVMLNTYIICVKIWLCLNRDKLLTKSGIGQGVLLEL